MLKQKCLVFSQVLFLQKILFPLETTYSHHSENSSPGTLSLPHNTIISFLQNFINKHFRHPVFLGLNIFQCSPKKLLIFPEKFIYGPSNLILSQSKICIFPRKSVFWISLGYHPAPKKSIHIYLWRV